MTRFFNALFNSILALFFLLIGITCILIPWSIDLRATLIQLILEEPLLLSLFGIAFFISGLAIAIHLVLNQRRSSYTVKSGPNWYSVDETVIQQSLTHYWKQLFPNHEVPTQIAIKKQKIRIAIELPYHPPSEQRPLLEKIKDDLTEIFSSKLGYPKNFSLNATFQPRS